MITLRPASIQDLIELGQVPHVAMVHIGGGSAYVVLDDECPVAAGGLFWHGRDQGFEGWLIVSEAVKTRPLALLRPLLRQLRTIRQGLKAGTPVNIYEGTGAVAFERLALMFGFTLVGQSQSPVGLVRRAISFGEHHG